MGGYRYNQPNHLALLIMNTHCFAYFIFDSIIEKLYDTSDFLTDCHHICVNIVYLSVFRSNTSAYEQIGKSTFFLIN